MKPAVQPFKGISVVGTIIYFAFFLLMPWYSRIDRTKPEPARVDEVKALRALIVLLAALPAAALASEEGYPLQEANADVSNLASLQRGARNFVNYCQGCHSAKYMRYSQLATDLALTEDDVKANLMFTGERIYDTMQSVMPPEKARQWFGNAPPDLSLIVRSRGADYVYTFLRSFYEDPSRPTGVNNAVLPGPRCRTCSQPLQGVQRPRFEKCTTRRASGPNGQQPVEAWRDCEPACRRHAGCDLRQLRARHVAFLEYVAEPAKAKRRSLGIWVVLFLLMFTAFTWFLYKEYWKDVK
jgi:ubiquinol-cytochrome c reductase cytochrome c1 subunit